MLTKMHPKVVKQKSWVSERGIDDGSVTVR